jgi:hypothetical protein
MTLHRHRTVQTVSTHALTHSSCPMLIHHTRLVPLATQPRRFTEYGRFAYCNRLVVMPAVPIWWRSVRWWFC